MRKLPIYILVIIVVVSMISCFSPAETTPVPSVPSSNVPPPQSSSPSMQGPWILPLPPGMQPRVLSEHEWEEVARIASSDSEVSEQIARGNIREQARWWVGYAGGPGFWNYPSPSISPEEWKGKASRFFPAIEFVYKNRTDRDGQIVGVDLDTGIIVLSSGKGLSIPYKRPFN